MAQQSTNTQCDAELAFRVFLNMNLLVFVKQQMSAIGSMAEWNTFKLGRLLPKAVVY